MFIYVVLSHSNYQASKIVFCFFLTISDLCIYWVIIRICMGERMRERIFRQWRNKYCLEIDSKDVFIIWLPKIIVFKYEYYKNNVRHYYYRHYFSNFHSVDLNEMRKIFSSTFEPLAINYMLGKILQAYWDVLTLTQT